MTKGKKQICKNCSLLRRMTCRGLCSPCYRDKAIRAGYPIHESLRQGEGIGEASETAAAPVDYPPGSPEKIKAMTERAARKEALTHERDAPPEGSDDSTPYVIPGARTGGLRGAFNHLANSED